MIRVNIIIHASMLLYTIEAGHELLNALSRWNRAIIEASQQLFASKS